jgi:hypothetical protein
MITNYNDIYNLIKGTRYRPKKYLEKYKFSQEILLDLFCSEAFICSFEDYYYDDISLDMIYETQPHIDKTKFKILWNELNKIREVELFCDFIIKDNPNFLTYNYNLIEKYTTKHLHNIKYDELVNDFIYILKKNKFIEKYCDNYIINTKSIKEIAQIILNNLYILINDDNIIKYSKILIVKN